MPQRKCALKRLKVDKKLASNNNKIKAQIKKELKGLLSLIQNGKLDEAKVKMKEAFSKLDRAAAKGIIHKNTAARRKSSLSIKLNKKA